MRSPSTIGQPAVGITRVFSPISRNTPAMYSATSAIPTPWALILGRRT